MSQPPEPDATYDADDLPCAELLPDLDERLAKLRAGSILWLVAKDPAAPAALRAWSARGGHALVHERAPEFWIRRRA